MYAVAAVKIAEKFQGGACAVTSGVGSVSDTLGSVLNAIWERRPDLTPSKYIRMRNGKWISVPDRYGTVGNLYMRGNTKGRYKGLNLGQRGNIKDRYQALATFKGRFGIKSRGIPKPANENNPGQQQGRMASGLPPTWPAQPARRVPNQNMSFNVLIKQRTNQNVNRNQFNKAIRAKLDANLAQVSRYNSGTASLRSLLDKLRLVNGTGINSDRIFTSVMELIERRVDDIVDNSRNRNLRYQKTKLNDLRQALGLNTLGFRNTPRFRRINEIFDRASRSLNSRISQKMNELRRAPSNRMNNIGRAPTLYSNQPPRNIVRPNVPVFTPPPNMPKPPPANLGPPLNLGERRALNNAGGETRALNLVQNAGGTNEVLKATSQLKEAGGSPALAEAMGANKKNIKIVLQLAGAPVNATKVNTNQLNNVAKVALAAPKLRKRRRSKRKPGSKKSGKPKVTALRKLLRSLPKKKLLAVLPKSNKNSLAGKNKANVATRVTSYLSGRTKAKK